jgi:hypothetical protein
VSRHFVAQVLSDEQPLALLIRLSVPGGRATKPEPVYGDQFNIALPFRT